MAVGGNGLIFNRFTREEMGLPPAVGVHSPWKRSLIRGMALILALWAGGWLAGKFMRNSRSRRLESLPFRVARAEPAEASRLLAGERPRAAATGDDPAAVLSWCAAVLTATEEAPRRLGYFGNLAHLLDGLGGELADRPGLAFHAETLQAHILSELGRCQDAFLAIGRAEKALSALPESPGSRALRLHLVNLQSYLLATVPEYEGRNPGRALHLAQTMISSRDEVAVGEYPSGSAALVDTLAAAWFAVGDRERALETQTLALGLAKPGDLAVYLAHYDAYRQGRVAAEPGLVAQK
ncbi:MAG: hypothetical protein LBT97_11800 [Planctomycetota bacterium]|nr:hypothetical protein [Planctomycetota bacterium]